MTWLRTLLIGLLAPLALTLSACQISYLMKSAASQADLLRRRVPVSDALKDPKLTDEQKRKLKLAEQARAFSENVIGLSHTENYTTYVQLDRPYVTYVVSAAARNELKHYLWTYPMVGALPYRGYFDPLDAKAEAEDMKKQGYDVYVRGVGAYSTLGWFRDPVLSSMLTYKDFELVNTIIHETVHATVYIKSEADFNERLANFIGNQGAIAFYKKTEGDSSPTVKTMLNDATDDKVFVAFISKELKDLTAWYEERKGSTIDESERTVRLKSIQVRFVKDVQPKFISKDSFKGFALGEINNARLLTYKLYFEDLSLFDSVFESLGRDFRKMIAFAKTLEKSKDPSADLAKKAKEAKETKDAKETAT
jgi:predicted aminopeptidase